ncbi:unnamed protein product, partial [Adineta steineri]
ILRTALYLDTNGVVVQHCLDVNIVTDDVKLFGFSVIDLQDNNNHEIDKRINEILNYSDLFDLARGHVIQCHILRHYRSNLLSLQNDDLLIDDDFILFNVHHSVFDGASLSIFLSDLSRAYETDDLLSIDDDTIQYIDYSVYERQMDMTLSRDFWQSQLQGYNFENSLALSFDRQRSSADQRSGSASVAEIFFNNEVATSFLNYASSHGVTTFQLGLAIFYAFLFRLTHGQNDLCIASINANRYRSELQNVIGMFVSTLPYRIELNSHWTFDELVKYVQEKCLAILGHTNYPLQHILADFDLNQSNGTFFETVFDFITVSSDIDHLSLNGKALDVVPLSESSEVAKFDSPASYAQSRICLDERIHSHYDQQFISIHNKPFIYRLQHQHSLSIDRLHQAIQQILIKHSTLHTSLIFHTEQNQFIQQIIDFNSNNNKLFFYFESTFQTDEQLNKIINDERHNPQHFDLVQGRVFRYHIVYYKQVSLNGFLSDKDVLIFNFHHALFDNSSMNVFFHDLNEAYSTGQLETDGNIDLRYIDYALMERQMPMTTASMFWMDTLHDYKLDQQLSLPYDRHNLADEHRTGRGISFSFDLDKRLSQEFLVYALSNKIKLEHLLFASYYAFLFKLTNSERDLCIGMNIENRYKEELKSIIGLFENIIPIRCQVDSHWSFHQLINNICEILTNNLEYSYFPLQRILAQHPNISKPTFLHILFEFQSNENQVIIDNNRLYDINKSIRNYEDQIMSISNFALIFQHDINNNQISCTINASLDLFETETINKIVQRFHLMLYQLSELMNNNEINKPIYELSLTLSDEKLRIQTINNTQTYTHFPSCMHHQFVYQVIKHPQKLAVELDEQFLTYAELLTYVQQLAIHLLDQYNIVPGDIISQCVERSLSMVIGIMAIEMIGCVYFPLSPRDPETRLHMLLHQTQSRLVLMHYLTKMKFNDHITLLDISSILMNNNSINDIEIDRLSNVKVTLDSIAYIIFTSGSTGVPKGARFRHRNFIQCIHSLVHIDSFNKNDTVIQMARCSFDNHIQEIVGSLMIGATLIMLHPKGTVELDYLAAIMKNKQISYMHSVPSLLRSLFTFLKQTNSLVSVTCLRSLCTIGEPCTMKLAKSILTNPTQKFVVWNLYGLTETTVVCTFHPVDVTADAEYIPIGRPLPNYGYMIADQFLQSVIIDQEGELFIGGVGVFDGYHGRDDLSAKLLIEIDGEAFYRTGDLVRIDNAGIINYIGRKDFQIKLHGQRIELGEIERCLLDTSISACVIIKWGDNHLIAYVQKTSDTNEKELREYCQSHLPPHMVPSIFIILEKLPLNVNGKIDRKSLPPPDLSSFDMSTPNESSVSYNELEKRLHDIWCQVLQCDGKQIPTTKNFFSVGGHSLLFIQLYHVYQTIFGFDSHALSIASFLQQPTIAQHSQLLESIKINDIDSEKWYTLHINQGVASFVQERIFLDEQVRFSTNAAVYNEVIAMRLTKGLISIERLSRALQLVLMKHPILRTSLIFNEIDGTLKQSVTDNHQTFTFHIEQTFENENELNNIIYETIINPNIFDLSNGGVFYCQILREKQFGNENNDNEHIRNSDILLMGFHHAAFDRSSFQIFFNDLCNIYNNNNNNKTCSEDKHLLQYIDYTVHERLLDMSPSQIFWHSQLEKYNMQCPLSLPVDRQRSSVGQKSPFSSVFNICFDNEMSTSFINYASSHQVTFFQLGLSIFYAFLFKLTHGQNDLCVSCVNAN